MGPRWLKVMSRRPAGSALHQKVIIPRNIPVFHVVADFLSSRIDLDHLADIHLATQRSLKLRHAYGKAYSGSSRALQPEDFR